MLLVIATSRYVTLMTTQEKFAFIWKIERLQITW